MHYALKTLYKDGHLEYETSEDLNLLSSKQDVREMKNDSVEATQINTYTHKIIANIEVQKEMNRCVVEGITAVRYF